MVDEEVPLIPHIPIVAMTAMMVIQLGCFSLHRYLGLQAKTTQWPLQNKAKESQKPLSLSLALGEFWLVTN